MSQLPQRAGLVAFLAALGWVVLRFGYRDVTERPEVCRAQIAAVHQQRAGMVPQTRISVLEMPAPGTMPPSTWASTGR
jgi:hypothetical protein